MTTRELEYQKGETPVGSRVLLVKRRGSSAIGTVVGIDPYGNVAIRTVDGKELVGEYGMDAIVTLRC
jgi:small nuclear ribonucleoprotein (snRNP)-like protein